MELIARDGLVLLPATIITSFLSMAATLWLAFYLLARGFPNLVSLRAVVSLFAISTFFLETYNSFFNQTPDTSTLRAILLITGMFGWYNVTFQLPSAIYRRKYQWMVIALFLLFVSTITVLIFTKTTFSREQGNEVYVVQLETSLPHMLYGATQVLISAGIIFNLFIDKRVRFMSQGRFFLFTSIFPAAGVLYGIIALFPTNQILPRLVQDILVFSGISLLAISVARHQSLLERRTLLQDFPASFLITVGLVSIYIFLSLKIGLGVESLGWVTALAITTHSLYDLSREFLERLRIRNDSSFRRQLRLIEYDQTNENKLQIYFQEGLDLLCNNLNTSSGIIAVWDEEKALVTASRNSVRVGSDISKDIPPSEELSKLDGKILNIEWLLPVFEGQKQIAIIGIGASNSKLEFSSGELDLFSEFADLVGTVVSIAKSQPKTEEQIIQLVEESGSNTLHMASAANDMLDTLTSTPQDEFVKIVEEGLRKYSDFVVLGQSPLAKLVNAKGATHIERGKVVQKILYQAIETLRPAEPRPPEPLPRIWYNYVVLHDAYIKGVINREVMARLYISEGTFHRTRRNALRGVARWLLEENYRVGNNFTKQKNMN